jgi:hypothetical protein
MLMVLLGANAALFGSRRYKYPGAVFELSIICVPQVILAIPWGVHVPPFVSHPGPGCGAEYVFVKADFEICQR